MMVTRQRFGVETQQTKLVSLRVIVVILSGGSINAALVVQADESRPNKPLSASRRSARP
jgi:hypothetical protein